MVIPLTVIFFLSCQATTAQLRDDSGVLNTFELSSLVDVVCEKELKIHQLLSNPLLSIVLKPVLRIHIPFLPGPDKYKPLYYLEWLEDNLGNLEDRLSDCLEGKPFVMEQSYVQHPNHTSVELGDLLLSADFLCKTTHLWYDIVSTKLSDLLGLWHIRLPIPDFRHKFQLNKALDFLDLYGIPDRIHRLLTGHLGLSTTTTTTHKPTFLESIFNQGLKTTTPKPKKPGFFESLFGSHTTTTTAATTTTKPSFLASLFGSHTTTTKAPPPTTTKPGFLAGLFGNHPASPASANPTATTKSPGGFLASLFGHTAATTTKRPAAVTTLKTTTKKPGGLFGGLLGEKTKDSTSISSETEIAEATTEDYNHTISDDLQISSSTKASGILSGLLHVKNPSSTPSSEILSGLLHVQKPSTTSSGGILSGLLHVKKPSTTSTVVPKIDESDMPDDLQVSSSTKSSGILSGLLHVKKPSTTSTVVPKIDESDMPDAQTSEKPEGLNLFRRKKSTISDFSQSTIATKKSNRPHTFGGKSHSETITTPLTEFGNKVDDKNIPKVIDSTTLLYTFDSKKTIHEIIEDIGAMDERSL